MTQPDLDRPEQTVGRQAHAALEVLHITGYFATETAAAYERVGLRAWQGYFASRSAPLGRVPGEVVVATFYGFSPGLVLAAIPAAWDTADPATVLAARHEGMAEVLHRVLDGTPAVDGVEEALGLARTATVGLRAHGRPLYAAHASLPWPDDPLLALWHAATLLREHRGDGHLSALTIAGLDPVEALVVHGDYGGTTRFLQKTRGWSEAEWADGQDRLAARGLWADGVLSPAGRELKAQIEAQTDAAGEAGWQHLGEPGSARLLALVAPVRDALVASDVFPARFTAPR